MNSASAQAELHGEKDGGNFWLWALLALAVCFVAISSQSLWIDEAFMARKASQPTLADWWRMMPEGSGSDLQMPLYMFYMWCFVKVFGLAEWSLRAANIPWFVVGAAAFISVFPKPQRLAAGAVTLLCPFAWFYLNEARPYAMQIGASLVVFAAIYHLNQNPASRRERDWFAVFWFAIVVLCGSSLLGVIWAGAAFLGVLFLFPLKRLVQLSRAHWFFCCLGCVCLIALASYYVWTIKFGARAVDAGNQSAGALTTAVKSAAHFRQGFAGGTELQNLVYVIYELFGYSGLGPGKLEIRTEKLHAFRQFAPLLGLYAITALGVLFMSARCIYLSGGLTKKVGLTFVILLPGLVLAAAGYRLGFLVLARHCTPILPVLLFLFSLGIAPSGSRSNLVFKACAGAFVILSLVSCLSLRFAKRHEKDDYRDAAQAANAALQRGQKVWWSAADDAAQYYHLPLAVVPGEQGRALLVLNPTSQTLATLPTPDVVITSKPDLYDNLNTVSNYVQSNSFAQTAAFPAFAVWQRKTSVSAP